MAVPVAARRLGSDEADQLRIISHQILRLADDLRNLHRTRVTHLLEASRRLMWLIVTLYLIFLIVGGGLIAVTSIAFNRGITSPLKRLAEATTKIAEGHLEERVPVRSSHEIGKLSHAFNVMADRLLTRETELETAQTQLEQRIREAQALYRLGTEISGLRDLNRILQFVVDSARELLHTDAAALSLLNPEQEALVVRAMSGSPEAFQLGVSVMRSFPLIGPLEAHSQYRHVMRPEYLRGHLSAVLSRGPKAIGVICVASRETREFTLAENELLSALATQAAIAIENARLNEEVQSVGILKERERIAREMHDGLAQSLALLHLRLQRAQQQAATANMVETARDLRDMAAIADHTYEEVRQSIFGLRTMVFRSLGLIPTLTEYLHDFSVQSGIPVSLDVPDGLAIHLPPEAEVQLLRIIQEALANVRKHAGANQAWVRLSRQDSWVQAIIEDDGQGFDPTILAKDDRRHVGLQSMRERAAGVGGRLEIDTAPGRGTRVKAWLPGEG
jgi:nitrate/nitrite-specific signal transduction histidine kinase